MGPLFLIIGLAALVLAIVSLITPKIAFFLKNKTRGKAFVAYLVIAIIGFIAGTSAMQGPASDKQTASQDAKAVESTTPLAETKPVIEPVAYIESEVSDTSIANRKRGQVFITLADPAVSFTQAHLAATCMSAAKYYAKQYGFKALSVFISDIPGDQPWEGSRLAQCDYSSDKGGWSGKDGWLWQNVKAAERPLTDAEREMKKLWGEARGKKIVRESEVSKYVAQKMGIQPDKVTLLYVFPENVNYREYEDISAQGPAK